ncbi:MAG: hypothetical protein QN229_05640 [Desulfurococcaceae archaeon TW002]
MPRALQLDKYVGCTDVTLLDTDGDGGFNKSWGWHLDPDTVEVADVTIELCDGMPSFVESELDY